MGGRTTIVSKNADPRHGNFQGWRQNTTSTSEPAIVYESPLASVVGKLRTVSLGTAIVGAVGVPAMVALKGSIPDTGMLALASTFVTGSIASTAAIHYIFGPYVYSIERIPVRVCSFKGESAEEEQDVGSEPQEQQEESMKTVDYTKPTLLMVTTKNVFLRRCEVVFDPEVDVEKYKGLRPMCNLIAKGTPLYVHPEFVHDSALRKILQLGEATQDAGPTKENPDDFL